MHEQRSKLYDEHDCIDDRERNARKRRPHHVEGLPLEHDRPHEGQPYCVDGEEHDEAVWSHVSKLLHQLV